MKTIQLCFFLTIGLITTTQAFTQIQAKTLEGEKVIFNQKNASWEYLEKSQNSRDLQTFSPEILQSVTTSRGEISLAELKSLYLSAAPDDEIIGIVDALYDEGSKCDCTVCHWPSHCTWGSDCSYQRNIPCSWCCP